MATLSIISPNFALQDQVAVVNTPDTVTFDRDWDIVEVLVQGGNIYFTVDGSTAAIAGGRCYKVLDGTALQVDVPTGGNTVVSLISSSTPTYSVTGVRTT